MNIELIRNNKKINEFTSFLLEENKKYNLTALTDENDFFIKNILDSLLTLEYFDYSEKTVMDLGSGAGFPGIPLAIFLPKTTFYLIEPTRKRADFLKKVRDKLNLNNVIVICNRVEDLEQIYRNKFDFVTSRAVCKLNMLLELSLPYLKVDGKLIAYKGIKYQEEIDESLCALKILKGEIKEVRKEILPFINETRFNIIVNKYDECDKKYPRLFAQIKKRPL